MLRRLLLGQPRRDEKDLSNDIYQRENRLTENSKAKNGETNQAQKNNGDTSESDSETESSSGTEDVSSDAESLFSRADCSFDDCTEDILDWKGFEKLKNDQTRKGEKVKSVKDEGRQETTANQGNPFADAFESQKDHMRQSYDEEKDGRQTDADYFAANKNTGNKNNNLNNTNGINISTKSNNRNKDEFVVANDNDKKKNDNELNEIDEKEDKKDILNKKNNSKSENNNSDNNKDIKINTKRATKENAPRPPEMKNDSNSEPTTSNNADITNNATKSATTKQPNPITNDNNNFQGSQMNSIRKTKNLHAHFEENHPKSTNNRTIPKRDPTSIFRGSNSSFHENQAKKSSKSYNQGKNSKVKQNQRSLIDRTGTTVDTRRCQGIEKGTGCTNEIFSDVSVSDLERFLGVNMVELREVIKKFKSDEDKGTIEENVEQSEAAQDSLGSPGDRTVTDGSKNGKIQRSKNEEKAVENKEEISSDSGVSEPDAHGTENQPHYITFKAIVKRRRCLEGHIKKLEERLVVMKDHEKDIQFVHDLFDLYNDSLANVERNNAGVPNVASLKSILARQLEEMNENDFTEKLKAIEDLGIPHFSEVNARVEKLRKRIQRSLRDNRKCRSKDVQKLRFDVGKLQGMSEAILECVYQK